MEGKVILLLDMWPMLNGAVRSQTFSLIVQFSLLLSGPCNILKHVRVFEREKRVWTAMSIEYIAHILV
jgi:hypothetical protein